MFEKPRLRGARLDQGPQNEPLTEYSKGPSVLSDISVRCFQSSSQNILCTCKGQNRLYTDLCMHWATAYMQSTAVYMYMYSNLVIHPD